MVLVRQLELRMNRWGGRRRGAGRPVGPNPRVRHLSREPLASRHPCHVTVRVREGVPSLRHAKLVREVERSWAKARERGDFRLVHYSIQSNHVHLIVEAKDADALGRGMNSLGSRLARAVNRVFVRAGRVLEDRYHHVVLRTPTQVRNALRYVLLNGRKHAGAKALKGSVLLDPASSSRWFDGWKRRFDDLVQQARGRPGGKVLAVAEPRTWLLNEGWRQKSLGGLLDPREVPN